MPSLRTSPNHVSCELAGETVIMDLGSGKYYGLDRVATTIWAFLQQPHTLAELTTHLLSKYDVSPNQCEADVSAHIEELTRLGLVEVDG